MTSSMITLIAAILAFLASVVATLAALYNGRFARFARERWLERQAEGYARIIEALADMVYYHETHLAASEQGRSIPETRRADIEHHWMQSSAALKKASAVGAFLVSREAEAALQKLWKDLEAAASQGSWHSELEDHYVASRDCLRRLVECAKVDLETSDKHPRPHGRPARRWRPVLYATAALVVAAVSVLGMNSLHRQRLWPFSTGTASVAFLGTTLGMSPQEAKRALAGQGAQLVSLDEYRRLTAEPNFMIGLPDAFPWETRGESLVVPSIDLFDSRVEAEVRFNESRLYSVSAYFVPTNAARAEGVVWTVDSSLRSAYRVAESRREESAEVPGAYTLHYGAGDRAASLWVNLTEPDKPIVNLTVVDKRAADALEETRRARQRSVFGPN